MNRLLLFIQVGVLALLPISELRGAIPFAIAKGIPWYVAYPFAAAINCLVAPGCWLFLSTVHRLLLGLSNTRLFHWYGVFMDRFLSRAREKLRGGISRWGWLGLAIFVAIPLPFTGAWTGSFGAWMLGMSKTRTILAVMLGVVIAGGIVTLVAMLGIQAFSIFLKHL